MGPENRASKKNLTHPNVSRYVNHRIAFYTIMINVMVSRHIPLARMKRRFVLRFLKMVRSKVVLTFTEIFLTIKMVFAFHILNTITMFINSMFFRCLPTC